MDNALNFDRYMKYLIWKRSIYDCIFVEYDVSILIKL
jgi:hypothetical protein